MLSYFKRRYKTQNIVKVSKSALLNNFGLFKELIPNKEICPVLKGNAYGHGLVNVAKVIEKENPAFIVVDSLYEAQKLSKSGVKNKILILGYNFAENLHKGLPYEFCAGDIDSAKRLAELDLPCHIEIDTGMSRMGFSLENFTETLSELKKMGLKINGLFSHFADADNTNNEFTKQQEKSFKSAISETHNAGFKPKWIHLANSAGALKTNIKEVNMIRLGFSLYGYSPYSPEDEFFANLKRLKPAIKLYSHIIACREINPGDKVSYNCTFEAKEKMRIGTIPLGYYEALPRSLSNKGPFLGRICMNHSVIKIDDHNKIGDEEEIFGDLNELAKLAGTIPYELMTRISETLKREIVD